MLTLKNYVSEDANPECPPQDVYTLELVSMSDLEEKQSRGFRETDPDVINTQSKFAFKIVDFDYDPDVDERDWNGFEVFSYPVFYRREVGQSPDENKFVYKSERANSYKLLTALGFDIEGGDDLNLDTAIGRRIKATIIPKASGWPKIDSPTKTRQRKAAAKPAGKNPYDDDDE